LWLYFVRETQKLPIWAASVDFVPGTGESLNLVCSDLSLAMAFVNDQKGKVFYATIELDE
jgi:hypothetical protein